MVVSDCMEMNAIKTYYGSVQGVQGALGAGVDLVCISHSAEVVEQSVQAVYQALEDGTLSIEEMEQSTAKFLLTRKNMRLAADASFMMTVRIRKSSGKSAEEPLPTSAEKIR